MQQSPNPSIERTCQGPLRAPCPAAHVKRWAPVGEAACTRCTVVGAGNWGFSCARWAAHSNAVTSARSSRHLQPGCPSVGGPLTASLSPKK